MGGCYKFLRDPLNYTFVWGGHNSIDKDHTQIKRIENQSRLREGQITVKESARALSPKSEEFSDSQGRLNA